MLATREVQKGWQYFSLRDREGTTWGIDFCISICILPCCLNLIPIKLNRQYFYRHNHDDHHHHKIQREKYQMLSPEHVLQSSLPTCNTASLLHSDSISLTQESDAPSGPQVTATGITPGATVQVPCSRGFWLFVVFSFGFCYWLCCKKKIKPSEICICIFTHSLFFKEKVNLEKLFTIGYNRSPALLIYLHFLGVNTSSLKSGLWPSHPLMAPKGTHGDGCGGPQGWIQCICRWKADATVCCLFLRLGQILVSAKTVSLCEQLKRILRDVTG